MLTPSSGLRKSRSRPYPPPSHLRCSRDSGCRVFRRGVRRGKPRLYGEFPPLAAAELRSAWTGEGARPHTSIPLEPTNQLGTVSIRENQL